MAQPYIANHSKQRRNLTPAVQVQKYQIQCSFFMAFQRFARGDRKSRRPVRTSALNPFTFDSVQFFAAFTSVKLRNSFSKALLGVIALCAVGPNISSMLATCMRRALTTYHGDVQVPFHNVPSSNIVFSELHKEAYFRAFALHAGGKTPVLPAPMNIFICTQ